MSLEDTAAQQRRGVVPKGRKAVPGYNPYDAPIARAPANSGGAPTLRARGLNPGRKPTDLRKLSEWIRLQRQVEALKSQKPEPDDQTPDSGHPKPDSDTDSE